MANPTYFSLSQSGSTGPDTALIQTWLNGIHDACTHYDPLTVDGKFGAGTTRAVQEFQIRNDLDADGKVGQKTWDALFAKYAAAHDGNEQYPGVLMSAGQTGATVKSAQQQLNTRGAKLDADGKFGVATTAAVRSFQSANGLTADGIIGPTTWSKLYSK